MKREQHLKQILKCLDLIDKNPLDSVRKVEFVKEVNIIEGALFRYES